VNATPTCVLLGEEALAIPCGEALLARRWSIATMVSRDPAVRRWAGEHGIPVVDRASALVEDAAAPQRVDYLFSITNLTVLPAEVLALARRDAINFHDGPLPGYAGLNAPAWALWHGETRHGVTWHRMTAQVDRGDILATRAIGIEREDTALTLNAKCFAAGIESFDELVERLVAGTIRATAQADGPGRYFGRDARPPAGGLIDWTEPGATVVRRVRALDFGHHANPLGTAKVSVDGRLRIVRALTATDRPSDASPGTIVSATADRIVVATATTDVAIGGLAALDGTPLDLAAAIVTRDGTRADRFDAIDPARRQWIGEADAMVARHEPFWRRRLAEAQPVHLPQMRASALAGGEVAALDRPRAPVAAIDVVAAACCAFARLVQRQEVTVGFTNPVMAAQFAGLEAHVAPQVPLSMRIAFDQGFAAARAAVAAAIREAHRRIGFAADLPARMPERPATVMPVAVVVVDALDHAGALPGAAVTLAVHADGGACRWLFDPARIDAVDVAALHAQVTVLLDTALTDPSRPVSTLPLLDDAARRRIVEEWNATEAPWRDDACVHDLIAEQVARTPNATAVICGERSLTYAELEARANRLARRLVRHGVGPDVLVGLFMERSADLPVALLAVHKAGGAYVPLDPDYPADRIAFMIADARMPVLLTTGHVRDRLPASDAVVIAVDADWASIAEHPATPLAGRETPANLAYAIYTSGSTGTPKGVLVEHRNVVNFFAGMDARVPAPGVWLAVTSLSFDISVLELCWTLTRGFTVVVATGDLTAAVGPAPRDATEFSLFYFASDAGEDRQDRYRLLLEGARFADRAGFAAVWTPERHFHAFGGLYPNPSVTGAAVAAVTQRVGIRAGSVVLPLHHPARVAEEWAVVDNISGGRVGLSFASGWQPDDFALRPENFAEAKQVMMRDIDVVRRLWRGEAMSFPGALDAPVEVRTLPRPVQAELPFWLTAAGNIDTFRAAGRAGGYLLTHLLGQTMEELRDKLAAYRESWREAGHRGTPRATLMLHSFVGADRDAVKALVRGPLTDYLRSSASLIRQHAWSFPAFRRRTGMGADGVDLAGLSDGEMAALLDHAFERYFEESGLFGTPEDCCAVVERAERAGVDEIACLIDFGVAPDVVLDHLPWLDRVRAEAAERATRAQGSSLAALMRRHGVTHLQCTPSMARMMIDGGLAASTFGQLTALMVGGEALPPSLAAELAAVTGGTLMNMYGPTETTIWSATDRIGVDGVVTLGRPLANQRVYVLDGCGQPTPVGIPGEIVIAGHGVTRGYLDRPALTAERFVADPFVAGERAYRTGDLGRFRSDGRIDFLGRLDHQVKIRGHRIELGEIEAALSALDDVAQAIVTARDGGAGDARLCAYVVPATGAMPTPGEVRERLRARLPDAMIPSHVVVLSAFPQTPNGKVDRAALPAPEAVVAVAPAAFVAPAEGMQAQIASLWCDVLKLADVGATDNFFDLGGHSLLAVQLHRRLRAEVAPALTITDIFRFPTVAALAAHLDDGGRAEAAAADAVQRRAAGRLAALGQRRGAPTRAIERS
jgi:natural product biosynthesis luciferase-like monooxygenase protein